MFSCYHLLQRVAALRCLHSVPRRSRWVLSTFNPSPCPLLGHFLLKNEVHWLRGSSLSVWSSDKSIKDLHFWCNAFNMYHFLFNLPWCLIPLPIYSGFIFIAFAVHSWFHSSWGVCMCTQHTFFLLPLPLCPYVLAYYFYIRSLNILFYIPYQVFKNLCHSKNDSNGLYHFSLPCFRNFCWKLGLMYLN